MSKLIYKVPISDAGLVPLKPLTRLQRLEIMWTDVTSRKAIDKAVRCNGVNFMAKPSRR